MGVTANLKELTTEVLCDGFDFLEGPRWHGDRLWVSDLFRQRVYTVTPDGSATEVAVVEGVPSGIGFLPDGRALIVSMQDRKVMRLEHDGSLEVHADLTPLVGDDSILNDMMTDSDGWSYVGNIGYDSVRGAEPKPGNIVLVSPTGSASVTNSGDLDLPNGCGLLPGGATMVTSESVAHRLLAWDVVDHTLTNRRVYSDLPDKLPDGLTVDAAGGVWVACFLSHEFLRLEDGTVTHRIATGNRRAVSCTLGGENRRTLFCLTADTSLEDLAQGRAKSRIETVIVDIPGASSP
ncbi:SMP-30/gluconolactonase/LRE family protein [Rhodococcus sp. NPDC019627]|uniref:SMP-30/gluconolactonase/LRE family protein n=1 Tax=unclassified Rhodococcus (in: high G+C Gram-positive bacteria) TaxID=192944 RepID=UPI0033E7E598